MSHKSKENSSANEEIFEIIELAIDDLELLTRAFNLIDAACEEINHPNLVLDDCCTEQLIH